MTFTYSLGTIVGQIRFEIGDKLPEPQGMLPDGRNISNEEITHVYEEEGDKWKAVARLFDAIAAEYAKVPTVYRLGPESEQISAYDYYTQLATKTRARVATRQTPFSSRAVDIIVYPAGRRQQL